jgi:hypothetical protein
MVAGGGRENGGTRKKEEMRKNEEERANGLCITQGRQPRWRPWCTTRRQGGAPLLVGPGARSKGVRPNGAL